jgi:uncharacterized protein involved in response to NO
MKGHRPFFLGAAAFAIVAIAFWLGILEFSAPSPGRLGPAQWHAHEMLFGYTIAVLAGFLLTGSTGARPAILFSLWLAGRVAMAIASDLPPVLVAAVDLAFAPALALLRSPPLWTSFKWPTAGFIPLLGCVFLANLLWHLEALDLVSWGARTGAFLAVDLFTLMIVVMAGRLVPGYTRAMLIPVRAPKDPLRERWSVIIAILLLVSDAAGWTIPSGLAALALGALQAWRLALWRTRDVVRRPLLLVLHVGFGWLVLGLLLRGLAELTPWISVADAIHATTVGAIGTLTLGMMGRLARIHARRELVANTIDVASYAMLFGGAVARVVVPVVAPQARQGAIVVAGMLWAAAFALFLLEHGRVLAGILPTARNGLPAGSEKRVDLGRSSRAISAASRSWSRRR